MKVNTSKLKKKKTPRKCERVCIYVVELGICKLPKYQYHERKDIQTFQTICNPMERVSRE